MQICRLRVIQSIESNVSNYYKADPVLSKLLKKRVGIGFVVIKHLLLAWAVVSVSVLSLLCSPPHLNNASTLPCKTWNSCFCENYNAGKSETREHCMSCFISLFSVVSTRQSIAWKNLSKSASGQRNFNACLRNNYHKITCYTALKSNN